MARIFGLEAVRMADADVLPYDYEEYGKEIAAYLDAARKRAEAKFGGRVLDFGPVNAAAHHFQTAGARILAKQKNPPRDVPALNQALRGAERALLLPQGLPHRPWFRHAIYAPGEYTGYAAVVIPGVNEALDKGDSEAARQQLAALASALDRAAKTLEGYRQHGLGTRSQPLSAHAARLGGGHIPCVVSDRRSFRRHSHLLYDDLHLDGPRAQPDCL